MYATMKGPYVLILIKNFKEDDRNDDIRTGIRATWRDL